MVSKQEILQIVSDASTEKPVGESRLARDFGIKPTDWQRYWARLSDAHREAGLVPNSFGERVYSDEELMQLYAEYIIENQRYPVTREWDLYRRTEQGPYSTRYRQRFGAREQIVDALREYCSNNKQYSEALNYLPITRSSGRQQVPATASTVDQHVYLLKAGKYYKVGRTNDLGRRNREINIELPEAATVVHSIRTDDAAGIEAYWHNRFASRRKNGEWFDLSADDVRAFRKRRFM